jgi:diaminohydroxyphosphoribosylaminopyrimidine deaminase/5-amino-6-(5-phosphoribosylamino)uracil reductase
MVGSLLVHNQTIIGEGYHQIFGEAHAEVNAIHSVSDKSLLPESTLYVNLEPCSHYGKTPPCAKHIIENRIPRVVISTPDPNPKVRGKGIESLKNAGIEVIINILQAQGEDLNKRFFTYFKKSRPYIILKWAQTEDRYIDIIRDLIHPQQPNWITNEEARILVHKWRSEEQSVMVGTNTALLDNPRLTVRSWTGNSPLRIVIDRMLRLPKNLHLFDGSIPTIIFTEMFTEDDDNPNIEYITIPFDEYLPEHILGQLYHRQITSLLIEGGNKLIETFIQANLWDEARVFTGKKCFMEGIPAPTIPVVPYYRESWDEFSLDVFYNKPL